MKKRLLTLFLTLFAVVIVACSGGNAGENASYNDEADFAAQATAPANVVNSDGANNDAAFNNEEMADEAMEEEFADFEEEAEEPWPEPEPAPENEPIEDSTEDPAGTFFEDYGVNPFIDSVEDNLSTFAIDVDTASYTVMRRYLNDGFLPPDSSVRVEEYVNYFDYEYPLPDENSAFAIHVEGAPSPFGDGDDYQLMRVGIQGYDVAAEDRPDAMLIFVIDVSGSMDSGNRLPLVKQSLTMLTNQLNPTDRIGIVTYGTVARVVLEPTQVADSGRIIDAIDSLQIEGSTNAEAGLRVAYDLAEEFMIDGGINRLILCSDGVANVGSTTAEEILTFAEQGVQLSSFGFGLGNYNDVFMEQLADQGDGTYAYIDTIDEAERVFAEDLTSTIFTIAQDAKIQVEFNPSVISQYRLIGYENRAIADEQFRDDTVDAGEIGAGHSVTALYEVRIVDGAPVNQAAVTVRVRYANPESLEITEIAQSTALRDFAESFESASPSFQLASIVAEYAEILRNSYWAQDSDMETLARHAERMTELFAGNFDVQEFAGLVAQAATLYE